MTEEHYLAKVAEALEKMKTDRKEGFKKHQAGSFKSNVRSKGFVWMANRPSLFFEWS